MLADTDVTDPVTGNGIETGYTTAPISYDEVVAAAQGVAPDHDLANVDLSFLASATTGTIAITLSDPSAVRLFTSSGVEFYDQTATGSGPLSVDLANPTGYVAGMRPGYPGASLWLEALHADANFVITISYSLGSTVVASRSISIELISLSYVSRGGQALNGVNWESDVNFERGQTRVGNPCYKVAESDRTHAVGFGGKAISPSLWRNHRTPCRRRLVGGRKENATRRCEQREGRREKDIRTVDGLHVYGCQSNQNISNQM